MRHLLAFVLILFTPTSMPLSAATPPDGYRVGGIVVDALIGQPLSLAEVTLAPVTALDDVQTFLTAPDGHFLFANLAPGKYRLMASRRGYAVQGFQQHESYMTAIVAGPGQDSEHIRFRLSPSAVLAGAVTDQWNDPVRDAAVILFEQSWSAGSRSLHPVNRTTTNDLGHYRFAHILPGTYAIEVIARPWWGDFVSQPLDFARHAYVLSRLGAQFGSSSRGDFIASLGSSTNTADTSVLSDPAVLEYLRRVASEPIAPNPVFDLVYPFTYFPNATSLSDAAKLSLRPGVTETVDITLRPIPSIHLHVRVPPASPGAESVSVQTEDADGEGSVPVQSEGTTNVEVSANTGGDAPHPIFTLRSEISPGLIELSGIPPGDITVSVGGSKGETEVTRTQSLQLTSNTELDLTSHGALVDVSGVVLIQQDAPDPQTDVAEQDSSPMSFMLEFRSRKTGESFKTSVSHKGEFSLAGSALTPGTYEVGLSDSPTFQISSLEATGASVSHRTIDIPGGQPVKLTIHTAEAKCSLNGIALKDGKPFAGAMILLVPQDADQDPALFHRDQSDSDGSFAMAPLFPGRYTLLAIENGWDIEWSNPAVLFKYLPNGPPVEIKPNASANFNAKVQ
ncbi:MAG TPA: carboxypeptidase regulatory-like domain-containing protein [Candidatus Acidoferrum sp.]|nr:carboxypeptidase regulatory-like domain-containing protein [Candidatus Acidoferrum sp.]